VRTLRSWALRLTDLFRKGRRDRELAEELESHLHFHIEDNLRLGMSPDEARRRALLALGGVEQTKERVRERRGFPWIHDLIQDVRFGVRMLFRHRGFTLVVLTVLGCGIGACIATFEIVNTVLLRPFPYHEPNRLVMLWERTSQEELPTSYLNFLDWRSRNRVFRHMAAYRTDDAVLTGAGPAERRQALVVSSDFLATLGVRPLLGRDFLVEDDRVGAEPVVVLTHALWNGMFHGDSAILGQAITINGKRAVVIGVLPEHFEFPAGGDLLMPLSTIAERLRSRGHDTGLLVVARLEDGVSPERAGAEMGSVMAELVQSHPEALAGRRLALATLDDFTFGDLPRTLWTLMGAVGFVLLIACTNVANLQMSRAASRRREVAIRNAIGATRGRVIRQFLTESVTASLVGGLLGLGLARLLIHALAVFGPGNIPRLSEVSIDTRTLLFTLGVSLLTGVLYGWIPALQMSKPDLSSLLKESERGSTPGHRSLGSALVVAEVALAMVLLIGGGLMIQTFWKLRRVDPGFVPQRLLTLQAMLPAREGEGGRLRAFIEVLRSRIRSLPGVHDVALSDGLPYIGTNQVPITLDDAAAKSGESPIALMYVTTGNYFEVMGLAVVRGRTYSASDGPAAPRVAVIDEALARKYFPGADPIGHRLGLGTDTPTPSMEIVGVVRHVKDRGMDERAQVQPQFYLALDQVADDVLPDLLGSAHVIVRAETDSPSLAPAVRGALNRLDPDMALFGVQTLEGLIADTMTPQRFSLLLLLVFGLLALVLAVVGLYASMAYNVSLRRQEIGIRMALGAQSSDMFAMVLRRSLRLTGIGLAIGAVAALALTRFLSGLLYGVSSSDPRTFLAVALLFTLVALLATYVPARRAACVDPMTVLRCE